MKQIVLGLIIFLSFSLFATDVTGNQSGNWTAADSPYILTGDVTVPAGETLTVEPGVQVLSNSGYQLTVTGNIIAEGTSADSIWFAFNGEGINWEGIKLEGTEASSFSFCSVKDAEEGINSVGAPVDISNCYITNNTQGIHVFAIGYNPLPAVLIDNCIITNSQENAIFIVENSNTTIQNCDISGSALSESPRGAIMLSAQGGHNNPSILNNYIHHNVWQGITAWDVTGAGNINPTIEGNEVAYNLSGIYLYYANGIVHDNYIHDNYVTGNVNSGAGVMVQGDTANPVFTNNEISGNFTGFYIVGGATPNLGDVYNANNMDDGFNWIHDNIDGSGNTWSVYNASSSDITAQNNIWDSEDATEIGVTINDSNDSGASGTVTFDPIFQHMYYAPENLNVTIDTSTDPWSIVIDFTGPDVWPWETIMGYRLYINDEMIQEFTETPMYYLPAMLPEMPFSVGVTAIYEDGIESETAVYEVTGLVLNPPANFAYMMEADNVELNWDAPEPGSELDLQSYKIYSGEGVFETTETSYILTGLENGETYQIGLTANYGDGYESDAVTVEFTYTGTSAEEDVLGAVSDVSIYPNPFNPTTTISFSTEQYGQNEQIKISVHNSKGQIVNSFVCHPSVAGRSNITWNGTDTAGNKVGSGIYFFQLKVGNKTAAMKKCLLLK